MKTVKLKILPTIWWSYIHAFKNIGFILRAGWMPIVVVSMLMISFYIFLTVGIEFPSYISDMFVIIIGSYFAVRWHRFIILNERQPKTFRFGRQEIIYSVVTASSYVLIEAINYFVLPNLEGNDPILAAIVALVMVFFYFSWLCCISMILPAVAVEDKEMTLGRAWGLWRGNRFRFFILLSLGTVIAFGVLCLAIKVWGYLSHQIFKLLGGEVGNIHLLGNDFQLSVLIYAISTTLLVFLLFIGLAANVGILTLTYASIVRHGLKVDGDYQPPQAIRDRVNN